MDSHLSIFPNNLFLKIFPKILFYFFFSENHGNSVQTSESYFTPLFNHHVPIFFYECIPRLPSILLLCRYSVNVIIMIMVVFFDGGIFMLKPAYQLLRFSKGERLFVFQKRLLSGVKSSQKLNFTVEADCHIEGANTKLGTFLEKNGVLYQNQSFDQNHHTEMCL